MKIKENQEPANNEVYGSHEEQPGRQRTLSWSLAGLILAILAWVITFSTGAIKSYVGLQVQLIVTMIVAVVSLLLCWLGRKSNGFVSMIGMVVSGSLVLFVIIGLIGTSLLD
ncbi:MAG: hypothetical protein K2M80_00430 [Muribaculaceae bacterium]|nr:hypothetical protein [Muribaculaceae bacterium]